MQALSDQLVSCIAKKYDISSPFIALTAGIDEALLTLACAYGQQTYIFTPTYNVYMDSVKYGGNVTHVGSLEFGNYNMSYENRPRATLFFLAISIFLSSLLLR